MHHQAEARKAAAPFEKSTDIWRQGHALAGNAMDRHARLEHERIAKGRDPGVLPEVGGIVDLDRLQPGLDQPDFVAERQVDRGDPHLVGAERVDGDAPAFDLPQDDVARQNGHGGAHVIVSRVGHPFFDVSDPIVLGHRGAAGHAPENTLLSFERAIALGADAIESDVQVTRDGVPVLLHDDVVDRVTNGAGSVDAFTLEELQDLDAGYYFGIDDRGFGIDDRGQTDPAAPTRFRGRGLRVPSLQEAFEAFPAARFNLEIKTSAAGVVAQVIELVAKFERERTTLLTAADDEIMVSIRAELASRSVGAATSASVSEVVAVVRSAVSGADPPSEIMALQIPMTFGDAPLVTPALVAHTRQHGIQLHVWTINDSDQMGELLDLGVDGLVTDFPDRAVHTIALRRRS